MNALNHLGHDYPSEQISRAAGHKLDLQMSGSEGPVLVDRADFPSVSHLKVWKQKPYKFLCSLRVVGEAQLKKVFRGPWINWKKMKALRTKPLPQRTR